MSFLTHSLLLLSSSSSFICCSMTPNQSHPLQTCTIQASLHIAASFASMQGLHPATEKAASPATKMQNEEEINHNYLFSLQGLATITYFHCKD